MLPAGSYVYPQVPLNSLTGYSRPHLFYKAIICYVNPITISVLRSDRSPRMYNCCQTLAIAICASAAYK